MKKNRAYTLIELIAVLVIMAILALIVTPLVSSIIKKAKISADKRSIDAYGRSIELAIAGYLMDTGDFPTSIGELTIEYSGDVVVCTTTNLNSDSSVYLAGCRVGGRSVEGYTYGKEEAAPTYESYSVGDEVSYNNINYYVIKESSASEESVTLLKAEPLSVADVNQYGEGHVNRYTSNSVGTAYDSNGYGGMAYYTSETCGYGQDSNLTDSGCTTDYAESEVKFVVDAWKTAKAPLATDARLMTYDEYKDNSEVHQVCTGNCYDAVTPNYDWMYVNDCWYWLGTPYTDSTSFMVVVFSNGEANRSEVYSANRGIYGTVRPVITISKSAL